MTFHGVSHAYYRNGRSAHVLSNISFDVAPGETLAVIGPSGSGKSTLLNLIVGRLKPSTGHVEVTTEQDSPPRRAFVFQAPTLLPWLTAFQNVRLPLELEECLDGVDTRVREALRRVGLEKFGEYKPGQMSGGMQSRVALARGLITRPNLLLLDEPFNDLDEATCDDMLVDLGRLISEERVTSVIVTHSLKQAAYLADHVVVLSAQNGGEIVSRHHIERRQRDHSHLDTPEFDATVRLLRDSLRNAIRVSTS